MTLLGILVAAFLVWLIWKGQVVFVPWLNRHIFSKVWHEEDRAPVARETVERIKELCVDGDVPEETAVVMAARESGLSEEQLLNHFDAKDAEELVRILSHKKPQLASYVLKKIMSLDRANMRR